MACRIGLLFVLWALFVMGVSTYNDVILVLCPINLLMLSGPVVRREDARVVWQRLHRCKPDQNLSQGWVGPDASIRLRRPAGEGATHTPIRSDQFRHARTRCVGPLEMPYDGWGVAGDGAWQRTERDLWASSSKALERGHGSSDVPTSAVP
jgi:hypothetical protein